ncbi:SGNH/GDSL hydrolase family protein [Sphingobacterium thalpophilum]|uniref:SGNH/GDSL hydrolase family protein n=1 Tax=Sphingobacterium thalpophilum TaxID=259 RepID=UPI003D97AC15
MFSKMTFVVLLSLAISVLKGQENYRWFSPLAVKQVQGRVNNHKISGFQRLPEDLKEHVRGPVWSLGRNAAGLYIDFQTSASEIVVKYQVEGPLNMPHMPTTGVSGLDLYAYDPVTKTWKWAYGRYNFADTVKYSWKNIGAHDNFKYRLYLPLYNTVKWLEIGVPNGLEIQYPPAADSKPIVVYGTSIGQGACASRPGLAWTNQVGRAFDNEVMNLCFSGNGRLEQPILNLMNEVNAACYILDCIPNLSVTTSRTERQLDSLLTHAVTFLRKQHPRTPIILTQHSSGHIPEVFNMDKNEEYQQSSRVLVASFEKLKSWGVEQIYLIPSKDLSLDLNSTVDYAHPNDQGMERIAHGYIHLLKSILK